jgi:hypothetical protein
MALADLARRQANYLGPADFRAMSNQTDERFRAAGRRALSGKSGRELRRSGLDEAGHH